MTKLKEQFQGYFHHGEVSIPHGWMQDPFTFNLHYMDDNNQLKLVGFDFTQSFYAKWKQEAKNSIFLNSLV